MTRGEMNWKIFRSVLPLIILVIFVYYTKSLNPNPTKMEPTIINDLNDLFWRFQMNEGDEFLYRFIQINGTITEFDSLSFILNHKVICNSKNLENFNPKIGQIIDIKGRCTGYDSILKKLIIDHVSVVI